MNSTTISRSSQISPMLDTSPSSDLVSLRNFVVDEDRANLGSDLWKSLDKSAFILAQRDAFEAYNLARAMSLSEESAAKEERIRLAQAEEAARSLARSWNVDGLQSALLKNTSVPSSSSPPRSSTRHPSASASSSRTILNRNPSTADNLSNTPSSSSKVSPPSGTAESSSQQKRRKASISQSQSHPQSQPHYSYSTSNYSYHYPSHNQSNTHPSGTGTSQALVHAQQQQQSEGRKHSPSSSSSSSASSRDIQAGQILNPKESSPRTQSPSSSASAQAAAAEREKEKQKQRSRSNSNSNSNSSSSSRKRSSSSAAQQDQAQAQAPQVQVPPQTQSQHQSQAQTHQQQHGPRDIFAPVRFNCAKCGNLVSSVVLSQPSLALTSPDPFAHPFASVLHVVCNNPSCGAVHCRGCLQVVKCRDVEHPPSSSDSQALVPISSTPSTSPPASNPASPIRPTFTFSKSQPHSHAQAQSQRACAGGPGCALWTCCPTVRAIAIWEALRAFDALFAAEAGFQVANQQWKAGGQAQTQLQGQGQGEAVVGRQYREAYIKLVISKADKSMRRFEDGFVRVLKVVASWLLQVSAEPCAQSGQDGGSRRQSTVLDESSDRDSQSPDTLLLLHLARLFLSSHLLEVVHTFLGNRNVKDWMAHAETYLDVLDVVGKMMDCGLGFLLKEVSGVSCSTPSSSSAPASGFYNPFAAAPSSSSSPSQSPPLASSSTQSGPQPAPPPPTLYDLISQLESYRGELKKFLAKVSFGVTVDKASKLHEAITYLVLQLVVGEF